MSEVINFDGLYAAAAENWASPIDSFAEMSTTVATKNFLKNYVVSVSSSNYISLRSIVFSVAILVVVGMLLTLNDSVKCISLFCWACFIKPFHSRGSHSTFNQQKNLELFYKSQANIYDKTREILLKGRLEALKLAYSHLAKVQSENRTNDKLVWVDIGGGTGLNVEKMSTICSLEETFEAIYLVDLSPSLCEVAQKRVERLNWKNVYVICADACDFQLLNHDSADFISFSYSLSMMPPYHAVIDHAYELLNENTGIVCSVDFGVQSSAHATSRVNSLGGLTNYHIPWIQRTFWRIWFECDKVYLDPSRREYLEYRFGTVKSLNLRNKTLGNIPYYIWLGVNKEFHDSVNDMVQRLEVSSEITTKELEVASKNLSKGLPFPSIFYQNETWRVYYDELNPQHEQFKNQYIYAFTWEDPREDAKILNLTPDDTILAITSACDSILAYASLPNPPREIHGVDLNPCQGHLAELKLASLRCLTHEEVWSLFGEGKINNFKEILTTRLAPHLSSNAFQYWLTQGLESFDGKGRGLYDTGSTRWALRLAKSIFKLLGLTSKVEQLCKARTIREQVIIWQKYLRPALFNPIVGKLLVGNPLFLWKALGVPSNQAKMMKTSISQYIIDTIDPIVTNSLISTDNYFYYLTLMGRYSRDNCPSYLTKKAHKTFQDTDKSPLDNIRLHTDFVSNVLRDFSNKTLTVAVIMDHMDWFDPKGDDAKDEISALLGALKKGGRVLLRSAAPHPWYIKTFEQLGFTCKAAAIRKSGQSIDRVNMYASTWICQKN
ncbi:hypothetical protein HG535_0G03400 [Zygotorulaspora mrakii]|uniref:Methyltransferase domain-containing protein n=1 Tax=Zygotorulaspora mrakii TaxID=42260 RepID=A0A7H9B792_ZYGMR|nr:uncharacterized protein HG535_0G03400 [Zygotorulaspora mrakii]QLG74457.1 hypothetical protein HG535_0G03400 [Zygotorulaspora mrakii]